jgi:hypothetical protein
MSERSLCDRERNRHEPPSDTAGRLHPTPAFGGAVYEGFRMWRSSRPRVARRLEEVADRKAVGDYDHIDVTGLMKDVYEIGPVVAANVTLACV